MMPKRTVVCDIETDGLLSNATQIWCIVCKDWDSGEIFSWIPEDIMDFPAWAEDNVHHWIGHNFVGYDLRVLKKIMGLRIRPSRVTDTLLLSRLYDITLKGGHSLENWGKILNYPKLPFKDFSEYNDKMLEYCINDVELTYKVAVALKFGGEANDIEAVTIEHRSQYIVDSQCEFGFALDVPKAHKLLAHLKSKATQLEETILAVAPPLPVPLQVIEPRYTKDGNLSKVNLKFMGTTDYTNVAGPFTRLKWEEFNLNSPKQKVKRLSPYWSPVIRTKGYRKLLDKQRDKTITQEEFNDKARYTWQLCEENLETINDDAPEELKLLGKYAVVSARAKEVEGWFDALGTDDRVHGTVFSIGAVTHRMSHNSPNMANIPAIGSAYGEVCRSCFTIGDPETHTLLGCDASGIQLRILAHYMDDDDYSHEVVNGDIHTKNLEAMGIDKGEWNDDKGQWTARDTAKTFIYAWLLGAGDEKVGLITGGTPADGRRVKETFLSSLPALARLKQNAASSARLGRLVGLDGRYIPIKSEHFALSCYLQGGESCVMKYAMLLWHEWIRKRKLDARQVAVVHDEFQIEVRKEHADEVGELVKQSIITAGQHFKLNVPMDAEYRTGENWAQTH
jgi:DNA polymerase-1